MYRKLILIDDSPLERFIGDAVIKKAGFAQEVISFNSATEALAYLETLKTDPANFPEIIFVDIQMPVMNGFGFLDMLMQFPEEILQHCKVVMLSSTLADEDFVRMKKYPVVRKFLTKPLGESTFEDLDLN